MKRKLLIIGSSQNLYGGIEAFMIAVAEAAQHWPEFELKLCFKFTNNAGADNDLLSMAEKACKSVHFVSRGSSELIKLVNWADVLHVQNMPPDIVIPAFLKRKKIFLTVHNRKQGTNSIHELLWSITIKLAHKRWFNSNFVWNTWEPKTKSRNSACIPTVCRLPDTYTPIQNRKGFIFVGRWIENKGLEEIIEAYQTGNFNREEWPLTLLGDGPLRTKILGIINEKGLKDVIMPGFVSDGQKQALISRSKWLLAPAKTLEDLGLTPIEARSAGVPSIVTRDGGLPEAGGAAALIAEPGNVESLKACMLEAVSMKESEYTRRSELAKSSLSDFLKPIDFYRNSFADN